MVVRTTFGVTYNCIKMGDQYLSTSDGDIYANSTNP